MSLRRDAVEVISLFGQPEWDELEAYAWAGRVLDALLDFLDAHTEEWGDEANRLSNRTVKDEVLLAALRVLRL